MQPAGNDNGNKITKKTTKKPEKDTESLASCSVYLAQCIGRDTPDILGCTTYHRKALHSHSTLQSAREQPSANY